MVDTIEGAHVSAGNIRAWIETGLRSMKRIGDNDEISNLGFCGVQFINGAWKYQDIKGLYLGDSLTDKEPLQVTWKVTNKQEVKVFKNYG